MNIEKSDMDENPIWEFIGFIALTMALVVVTVVLKAWILGQGYIEDDTAAIVVAWLFIAPAGLILVEPVVNLSSWVGSWLTYSSIERMLGISAEVTPEPGTRPCILCTGTGHLVKTDQTCTRCSGTGRMEMPKW